jgi:type II secretory pathway component PulF
VKQTAVSKKIGRALDIPFHDYSAAIVVVIVMVTSVMPPLIVMFSSVGNALSITNKVLMSLTTCYTTSCNCWSSAVLAGCRVMDDEPTDRERILAVLNNAPLIGSPTYVCELAVVADDVRTV